jgi:hypothetical protein
MHLATICIHKHAHTVQRQQRVTIQSMMKSSAPASQLYESTTCTHADCRQWWSCICVCACKSNKLTSVWPAAAYGQCWIIGSSSCTSSAQPLPCCSFCWQQRAQPSPTTASSLFSRMRAVLSSTGESMGSDIYAVLGSCCCCCCGWHVPGREAAVVPASSHACLVHAGAPGATRSHSNWLHNCVPTLTAAQLQGCRHKTRRSAS